MGIQDKTLKAAIDVLNRHIKQYNGNNGTNYKYYTYNDLDKLGLIDEYYRVSKIINNPNFLLLIPPLGYIEGNIHIGDSKSKTDMLRKLPYKYCGKCKRILSKEKFKTDTSKYDRLTSMCNECIVESHRTKKGLLRRLYNRQVHSSKERNHPKPEYDKKWLTEWCLNQDKFHKLYKEWVDSGYDKNKTPSIDRINPVLPYLKDNIQLMTWRENNVKGHKENWDLVVRRNGAKMSKSVKNLVVLESPAKTKTINKILGNGYVTKASFGHIRDLPKNKLGIDPDKDFELEYVIYPDKRKVVKELKSLVGPDTIVWLASDDDAEGEAISWHLREVLKSTGCEFKRIVFHEITKPAILHAFANPVDIDINRVNAQQARRSLDRIIGYKLSPLLWQKIKYGLSAGRTQSVALRIVVDREREIEAFIPEEYWKIKLDILSNPKFRAELNKVDNKKIKIANEAEATHIKNECVKSDYELVKIDEKESYRSPPPPFTTSTIQQEASRKLGFSVKQTMQIAQKLYEGNMVIPNHTGGLITYMRTDSLNLSKTATDMAKEVILSEYGSEYALDHPRSYINKTKGAAEAHEALRPTNMFLKPSKIKGYLDPREYKLYSLIWQRTMATQMAKAKVATTTYFINGGVKKNYEFIAKGTKILFPGFMKAYTEGSDDPEASLDDREKFLPNVPVNTIFKDTELITEQLFTKPPARYTEATLVKKLESAGVGRPSTYASMIGTIMTREYVVKTKDKRLEPTVIGKAVRDYLVENFPDIISIDFTAKMETNLDKIHKGELEWKKVVADFYFPFMKNIEAKAGGDRFNYSEEKEIGKDPATGKTIYFKSGAYGDYVQLGEKDPEDKKKKPRVASVPKGTSKDDVDLKLALHLLQLPKKLGELDGYTVNVAIGRFGPMLTWNGKYFGLKDDDPYTITFDRAKEVIAEIEKARQAAIIREDKATGAIFIIGRYGMYLKVGKNNLKLPKELKDDMEAVKKLTDVEVKELVDNLMKDYKPKKKFKKRK